MLRCCLHLCVSLAWASGANNCRMLRHLRRSHLRQRVNTWAPLLLFFPMAKQALCRYHLLTAALSERTLLAFRQRHLAARKLLYQLASRSSLSRPTNGRKLHLANTCLG